MDIAITNPTSTPKEAPFMVQGTTVTGIVLVAQRIAIMLGTKMADILRSDEGTSLINALGNSSIDKETVGLLVTAALSDVILIMRSDEDLYDESERLGTVSVDNISIDQDTVYITLNISTVSGDTASTSTEVSI